VHYLPIAIAYCLHIYLLLPLQGSCVPTQAAFMDFLLVNERGRGGGFVFNERSCNSVARCFVLVNVVLVCTL
jgi:hypothetical protein